jgi:pentatricopeptide repeat protein
MTWCCILRDDHSAFNRSVRRGEDEEALRVVAEMAEAGVRLNYRGYITLLNVYERLGRPEDCRQVFDEARRKGVWGRQGGVPLTIVVKALCKAGDTGGVLAMLEGEGRALVLCVRDLR